MLNFITKLFDYNARDIERLKKQVAAINDLESKVQALHDADFKKETEKLKKEVNGDSSKLNEILPWAYALVREAAVRSLKMRHFDAQLIAGIALHEGRIAEQKTGEGKTLTATTALYLNALVGKGVHLVTVNDYLARRDAGWMGQVFNFLGLTTASIIGDTSFIYDSEFTDSEAHDSRLTHLKPVSRKEAYAADVTYGINSEFGFDYLRDNMATFADQAVQRGFYYAIIDEADSVLIDEARTPHIISAPVEQDTSQYYQYAKIVRRLNPATDYVIDEKLRTAHLTEAGISSIEKSLGTENIYEKDFQMLFHIEAALKAETLFKNDKDYIVKDGEVVIVDEFTGRLLPGRRFSEGLHQAIEAKENVVIQRESRTLATVSLQNYFRMYEKLAGMTGTAATEAEEFNKIYKTDVLTVPTQRPMIRKDEPDMIYKTENAKYNAVVEMIAEQYKQGRPVLVGTTSIKKNELVSRLLKQKGIPHELLNAKNHEREAQIIARAGEKGAVTVATNMAGRGVDIILGGDQNTVDADNKKKNEWQKKHDEVVEVGGLFVIGTERHESRRIDNQLRGRSGRQGDPGETRFFVSFEDDLMRIFGGEQISKLMTAFNFPEDQPLSHGLVSRAIEQAQVKVEGFNFDIRKHLVEYDDVLNRQRDILYTLRRKILFGLQKGQDEVFRQTLADILKKQIVALVGDYETIRENLSAEERENFGKEILTLVPITLEEVQPYLKKSGEELQNFLIKAATELMDKKEKSVDKGVWISIVHTVILQVIDQYWTEHLTAIEDLREGINLRGYAQQDPLVAYKNEAFTMFERLLNDIYSESMRRILRMEVKVAEALSSPQPEQKKVEYKSASSVDAFKQAEEQALEATPVETVSPPATTSQMSHNPEQVSGYRVITPGTVNEHSKIGRNDPCWCGSGKKYKKCHYPN